MKGCYPLVGLLALVIEINEDCEFCTCYYSDEPEKTFTREIFYDEQGEPYIFQHEGETVIYLSEVERC